jgi:molybdate transport system substrate-binding protein
MKKILLFVFISFSFYALAEEKPVKIAAAANLSDILEELKTDFNKINPDITLEINYGASGKFASQIEQGAPFDLFMSADMGFPEKLAKAGFAEAAPRIYARGRLIIFTVKKVDLKNGLNMIKDNNIKTISICNPETAPYGRAAIEALTNSGILNDVESELVRTESVAQVIQQVISASDIGFTAESLVFSKGMSAYKEGINWVEIDPALYKKIEQGIIILKKAAGKSEVRIFYDYIFSAKAKAIFSKYRYD